MTNTYQNFLALRRMVFGHLRLLAIFVGVTFIVDHWRSSGGHDAAQGYANGQVAYLASGGPAFVPLSPATLLNKMHKDASFDVGDAISAIVQSFDDSKRGQVLESYLIWAISTERSDSYIDTLLNSAAAKGDFKVPPALTTASGALDTAGLLTAVVVAERRSSSCSRRAADPPIRRLLPQSGRASLSGRSRSAAGWIRPGAAAQLSAPAFPLHFAQTRCRTLELEGAFPLQI